MSRHCVKCRAPPHGEYRIGGEWVPACSETCARAAMPERDVRARIGRALDTALIGPEQATIDDDLFAGIPDELVVEILRSYPPSSLLRIAGTNQRLRAIVLDPRVINDLVNSSFERGGYLVINEWVLLARRAVNTGQVELVKAVVTAIDAREMDHFDIDGPEYTTTHWIRTRFGLALQTHDVDFVLRIMPRIQPDDIAGFLPRAIQLSVRESNDATLRTLLTAMRQTNRLFSCILSRRIKRETLFANVSLFRMLLESGVWNVANEHSETQPGRLTHDCVLIDAIAMKRADIVQILVDDGRLSMTPSLITYSITAEIADILLRSRSVNPLGVKTLAEFRKLPPMGMAVATALMEGVDFEW